MLRRTGRYGPCQVAVHLTYASPHGHAPIDRALYLGAEWAADEERRLFTDVPDAHRPGHATVLVRRHRDTRELSIYGCTPPLPSPWLILWTWCAAGGTSRRTSTLPRASAASPRARPPAGPPGCAGL
ncbi:transposase [Streptomyces sp. NBC_01373]|nr:transposase [Streptomyces sp. NBC_01373]